METTQERVIPHVGESLLTATLIVATLIAVMEIVLAFRGIHATAVDDERAWIAQRHRASTLGNHALILIGASRIQTDIDVDILRTATRLEPVQLAIDASSFAPILHGLAEDSTVTGTVLVSYQDSAFVPTNGADTATRFQQLYESARGRLDTIDFNSVEYRLDSEFRSHLRTFADGARPLTTLVTRILTLNPLPQYATFLPDRSRLADYAHVDMTQAYYSRVLRELGDDLIIDPGADLQKVDADIRERIARSPEITHERYLEGAESIVASVRKIQSRGGRVFFISFPTSGLIREMEDHACPRARCWDWFVAQTAAGHLNFEDVPYLREFPVPDGSHIDFRNRAQLTLAVVQLLDLSAERP